LGFFSGFASLFRKQKPVVVNKIVRPRRLAGRYDASMTTDNNRKHWINADSLSANAANSADIRQKLRDRSRYEVANNSYASGIVRTLVGDIVGTGPRLQLETGDDKLNEEIESLWRKWSASRRLPEKLRTLRRARCVDGEGFGVFVNRDVVRNEPALDLKLYECDQVSHGTQTCDEIVDGVEVGEDGEVVGYWFLPNHPGDGLSWNDDPELILKSRVVHLFSPDRAGQLRGIPELTPGLPLYAMMRDYSLATLDAAKAAAYYAGILKTNAAAEDGDEEPEALDPFELERNTILTMPKGYSMEQLKAEQPTGTYKEFKREILGEAARGLNMPFNIAACNSSDYNYASGRMDHQTYGRTIEVDRGDVESIAVTPFFMEWAREAVLIDGYISARGLNPEEWEVSWYWDGREHVDPAKEANAQETRLGNQTTTLEAEYARTGKDWRMALKQIAAERAYMKELGITPEPEKPAAEPVSSKKDAPAKDVEARWSGVSLASGLVNSPSASLDLIARRGESLSRSFRWLSADKSGVPLDDAEIKLTARNKDGGVLFVCSDASGHVKRDASSVGLFSVSLTPDLVASAIDNKDDGTTYTLDVTSCGRVYRLSEGNIYRA